MNLREWLRPSHAGHDTPEIVRASAEVFSRLVAVTEALERHVAELEQELQERGQRG